MLGEMIAEDQGKITAIRVLPCAGQNPQFEVSFQAAGRIFGVEYTELCTYQSELTAAGVMRGQGQGVLTTKDGELITWTGEGIGKPKGKGSAASWRGSMFYQTSCQRLANLNGLCAVFEHEVDEDGNAKSRVYEWK